MEELENYKPSFTERLFKSQAEKKKLELEKKVEEAAKEDARDYEEWKNLHILSERVLNGDIDAYLQVIGEMNPLEKQHITPFCRTMYAAAP